MEFQRGDVIEDKYEITALLGRGGMGVVYAARHRELGELVALKFLLPALGDDPGIADRFLHEARAGMRIKSLHVARVHDVGTAAGAPFMVMEHLVGRDLAAILDERGQMPIAESADLLLQACEAIHEAHALGIIHRDLKPANLFVTTGPDGLPFVKVLDFGISKSISPDGASSTSTRGVIGTPFYMSPEQLTAAGSVDARADVWSLGVVLYEMLADTVPFPGATLPEIHAAILRGDEAKLSEHCEQAPAALVDLISHALQRDRAARLPTVAAFAGALAPFGTEVARESAARIQRIVAHAQGAWDGRPSTPAAALAGDLASRETAIDVVTHPEPSTDQPARSAPRPTPSRRLRTLGIAGATTLAAALLWPRAAPKHDAAVPAPSSAAATTAPAQPGAPTACNGTATSECELACTANELGACESLAVALEKGLGAPRDVARAATLYAAECDHASLSACNSLGALYGRGDGVPQDNTKAVALYTRGCDGGYGRACMNLGGMHFDGSGVPKNETLGAQLFLRACENGEPLGCENVAIAYRTGRGVPKDVARSFVFAGRACDAGVAVGCLAPSLAKITGDGVPQDVKAGIDGLDAMCTKGNAAACVQLAALYAKSSPGVTADPLRVREYERHACDLGSKQACELQKLDVLVDRSNNGAARQQAQFETQCNAGSMTMCAAAGESLFGVDRARAIAFFTKACKGGVAHACKRLADAGVR